SDRLRNRAALGPRRRDHRPRPHGTPLLDPRAPRGLAIYLDAAPVDATSCASGTHRNWSLLSGKRTSSGAMVSTPTILSASPLRAQKLAARCSTSFMTSLVLVMKPQVEPCIR